MRRFIISILLFAATLFAQTAGGYKAGAKIIDVGFSDAELINTSVVGKSEYVLFRWEREADYFRIVYGFPKCILADKPGLSPLHDEFCLNFVSPQEVREKSYLLKASYFDTVFRVYAYKQKTLIGISQTRYVKQKR